MDTPPWWPTQATASEQPLTPPPRAEQSTVLAPVRGCSSAADTGSQPCSLQKSQGRSPRPLAPLPARLTCDIGAHDGQRGQVRGAEGREPARVHLGHSVAPKQLILEEEANLQGRGEAVAQPRGAPVPSSLPPAISAERSLQTPEGCPGRGLPPAPLPAVGPGARRARGPATLPSPLAHCPHRCFPGNPVNSAQGCGERPLPGAAGSQQALLRSSGGGGSGAAHPRLLVSLEQFSWGAAGGTATPHVGDTASPGWVPTSQHGVPYNVRGCCGVPCGPP